MISAMDPRQLIKNDHMNSSLSFYPIILYVDSLFHISFATSTPSTCCISHALTSALIGLCCTGKLS